MSVEYQVRSLWAKNIQKEEELKYLRDLLKKAEEELRLCQKQLAKDAADTLLALHDQRGADFAPDQVSANTAPEVMRSLQMQ
ncbi:hypothetical protein [Endozoicomonas euniceicola]|uniref:Uncharacterized protein n=1 Tax=Endozoicomonas euniceicola TaxID=1234143 RepID=A0ABY6H120_9GAMM|nr:hypothetical protein [Endozoicomonas euniceicola]UYM18738.1 hypothetical protein NX720_12805 [Endozoicomonas euniceicola]